jgi:hypothetical protein
MYSPDMAPVYFAIFIYEETDTPQEMRFWSIQDLCGANSKSGALCYQQWFPNKIFIAMKISQTFI